MRMPVLDGRAATRLIKGSLQQGQQTVIVAVSAGVLAEERTAVLADGCDDFVAKPIHTETIVAQLVKHLGVRFIYAEDAPTAAAASSADAPPAFDLAGLPAAWVAQARSAAVAADAARLLALAAAVEAKQPALVNMLRRWVGDYDYAAIEAALPHAEEERTR